MHTATLYIQNNPENKRNVDCLTHTSSFQNPWRTGSGYNISMLSMVRFVD